VEIRDYFVGISSNALYAALIFTIIWANNFFVRCALVIFHFLYAIFSLKKYILIWNDDDIAYSMKISKKLEHEYPTVLFRSLSTPKELLNFPKNSFVVKSVILIVSDVTKLSEDKSIKDKIQNWLIKFLGKGGGIIGTHDIIYRRVRNDRLEKAFGCQLNNFKRIEGKVKYIKNRTVINHIMVKDLPDLFEMDDFEILWGNWDHDIIRIFQTEGNDSKPLVVAREYSRGKVVWINSGDKKDHIPKSISQPESEFIILLRNAIKWVTLPERNNMYKKIIAHRGASAYAKENSIKSFQKAIEVGADMIEFDIRKTKDNIYITYHDECINDKLINELTYEQIRMLDNDIPKVEEILKLVKGKIKLDVELKEEGYEKEIIKLLLKDLKDDEFVITSFNDTSLKVIKKNYPNIKVGLLLGKENPKNLVRTRLSELFPMRRALQAKADFLVPHWKLLRFGFLKRARKNNKPVFVWTVNDEGMIGQFLNNHLIDAIITDKPDIALSIQK